MTDTTLLPCKCGEPVVYHAPEAADELGWILCPKCFCEMSEFHFSSPEEMFAAWNRRDQWRPISEWMPTPEQHLFQCEIDGPGFYYETGNLCPEHAVMFMKITPPAPVSGGK